MPSILPAIAASSSIMRDSSFPADRDAENVALIFSLRIYYIERRRRAFIHTRGVADLGGPTANQHDGFVSRLLQQPQNHYLHERAHVQRGRRRLYRPEHQGARRRRQRTHLPLSFFIEREIERRVLKEEEEEEEALGRKPSACAKTPRERNDAARARRIQDTPRRFPRPSSRRAPQGPCSPSGTLRACACACARVVCYDGAGRVPRSRIARKNDDLSSSPSRAPEHVLTCQDKHCRSTQRLAPIHPAPRAIAFMPWFFSLGNATSHLEKTDAKGAQRPQREDTAVCAIMDTAVCVRLRFAPSASASAAPRRTAPRVLREAPSTTAAPAPPPATWLQSQAAGASPILDLLARFFGESSNPGARGWKTQVAGGSSQVSAKLHFSYKVYLPKLLPPL